MGFFFLASLQNHSRTYPGSIATISRENSLSFSFLQKVAHVLKRAGIVVAVRGKEGGYYLSRPPRRIRIREVVEALDGPIRVMHCLDDSQTLSGRASVCPRSSFCKIRRGFHRFNQGVVRQYLAKTLSDFLRE